jgi:hypothetical protein
VSERRKMYGVSKWRFRDLFARWDWRIFKWMHPSPVLIDEPLDDAEPTEAVLIITTMGGDICSNCGSIADPTETHHITRRDNPFDEHSYPGCGARFTGKALPPGMPANRGPDLPVVPIPYPGTPSGS